MTALPLMPATELTDLADDPEAGFGALRTARGQLPLKAMDVQTRISGLAAQTALRQTFSNALEEPLEATYVFPLPPRGAVTSFQMAIDGRIVDGLLRERGAARREYQEAIEAGHRAAITEEERPNVFTLRVGNLMPGEDAEIRLTVTSPLPFSDGEATFRFPLVVAPRYIPGTPLAGESVGDGVATDTDAVPDASRISPPVLLPGFPNPVALSLAVEVDTAGLGASDLRSSLHSVVTRTGSSERWHRVELRPGERLDRDFVLRFGVAEERVRTELLVHPDAEGDEGTFHLTLTPPLSDTRGARPRDVVFVIDRSGSMGGWKMVAARRALGRMVDTLAAKDRFDVLAFDDRIERVAEFTGALTEATDRNRFRAIEFLAKLDARGGTEMARPLMQAADALGGGYADRDPVLVLITDGQVGNEAQILKTLAPRLKRTRVFTLGVDRAVNSGFLQRLAAVGGGGYELVESEDRLDEVMARIHRRIDNPVLTELRVETDGLALEAESQVPSRLPDLFAGTPLTVSGRYRGKATGALRLTATDAAGGKWSARVEALSAELPAIGVLWARGRLRELEDRYDIGGGGPSDVERIVAISLRFNVLCRFTAFVAVDRSEKVNVGGEVHHVTQPVEAPDGWALFNQQAISGGMPMPAAAPVGSGPPPGTAYAMAPPSGAFGEGGAGRGSGGVFKKLASAFLGGVTDQKAQDEAIELARAEVAKERARRPAAKTASIHPSMFEERGDREEARAELEVDDLLLAGYRRRAERLRGALEGARGAELGERRRALGRLVVGLRELLEDAASVGVPRSALSELRTLMEAVKTAVGGAETLDETAVSGLFEEALRVLVGFASGAPTAEPARRDEFWK